MDRRQVQQAMDRGLTPLRFTPDLQARTLAAARGEIKVKKKVSAGMVLALVLMLLVVTALAVVTLQETGRLMARLEQEQGGYPDWPADKKVQVVLDLMAAGHIPETDERIALKEGRLAGDAAVRTADAAIAELTGENAKDASFLSIMQAAWGPFDSWSAEQQAWYTQVSEEAGAVTLGKTRFVRPTGKVTKENALRIARQALAKSYGIPESALDDYRVTQSFQIPEFAAADDRQAYWCVTFDSWNTGMKAEDLPFTAINLFVHPETGELLYTVEDLRAQRDAAKAVQDHPLRKDVTGFKAEIGETEHFLGWRVESKARWTQEIAPRIKAFLEEHPDQADMMFSWEERASTVYAYGLPDDRALPQDRALDLAREALKKAYRLNDEEMALLQDTLPNRMAGAAYDVTDPTRPLWKFVLTMPTIYDSDGQVAARVKALYGTGKHNRLFKVDMDARTGEVLRTMAMPHIEHLLDDIMSGYSQLF